MTLVEKVAQRVQSTEGAQVDKATMFSPEALAAMKLADQFADIQPEHYVLPLDALAGFKVQQPSD